MAEAKDAQNNNHIVEIPVTVDEEQKVRNALTTLSQHPMMEISQSPGHLLLLKLWQREEDMFARRSSIKESRMDSIRGDIFQLCCFFFLFHGFFLTILFMSSILDEEVDMRCQKWWIPSILSIATSLAIAVQVHMKLHKYWKVAGQLQRQKGDNRAVTRCIQELRMKGASFDLSKEPQINFKRMKSSSVEIKWKPISWCSHYLVTLCLFLFAGLAFPVPKLFLCIF